MKRQKAPTFHLGTAIRRHLLKNSW